MSNPFFLPDHPAPSSSGALRRHSGKFAPFFLLVVGSAWLVVSIAAILLTLGDALPANKTGGTFIAELD